MFSGSLGRVVLRSTCTAPSASPLSSVAISTRALSTSAGRPKAVFEGTRSHLPQPRPLLQTAAHQRRYSSSKTSIPPDGSKRTAPSQTASGTSGRISRRKSKEPALPADIDARNLPFSKQYPNLPSVPSTQHLRLEGMFGISSSSCLKIYISAATGAPVLRPIRVYKRCLLTMTYRHLRIFLLLPTPSRVRHARYPQRLDRSPIQQPFRAAHTQ
jgi:hypothetical protein